MVAGHEERGLVEVERQRQPRGHRRGLDAGHRLDALQRASQNCWARASS
jgi:hypothetical protein